MLKFFQVIFFLFIFLSVQSWASRARVSAFQSNHLLDTEHIYLYPTKILEISDYITMQSGSTAAPDYLGRPSMAARKSFNNDVADNYALGITLGRHSELMDSARKQANSLLSANFAFSQNSIEFDYATRSLGKSYSIGIFYAAENDKLHNAKNDLGGLNLGLRIDDLTLALNTGLLNKVDDAIADTRLVVDQSVMASLLYEFDDIHFLIDLSSSRAIKLLSGIETHDFELLNYKMGVVKNIFNGNEIIFYRLNLETRQTKNRVTNSIVKEIELPLTLGFESVLTDEIKLRSSIKQIVGIYQGEDFGPGNNTTTAAVGLGFIFGKLNIDGVFQGLVGSTANQRIDGNNFMTDISLTYWF